MISRPAKLSDDVPVPTIAEAIMHSASPELEGREKEALEIASPEERPDAEYIITGKYPVWKNVVQGKQEPLRALMTRKLKLIKGKQLKLLKEVKLALKLINSCTQVDATYPDEKG